MVPAAMIPRGANDQNLQTGVMQPFQPGKDQQVQMVDQAKLMEILSNVQKSLDVNPSSGDS